MTILRGGRKAKTESRVRKTTRHKEKSASENEATDGKGESKNKVFKMGEKKNLNTQNQSLPRCNKNTTEHLTQVCQNEQQDSQQI